MWIRRVEIGGFGRLVDRTLEFGEGLNCVYGANEAGKTTLLEFLLSMLFGQAQAGKTRRYLDEIHEKYVPWNASRYGGYTAVELSDGRELLLKRDFSGNAETLEILDARTGKETSREYTQGQTREYLFVSDEAKIDKTTFEGVFVVTHSSVATLAAAADANIADRLVALAEMGNEKAGSDRAQAVIGKAIESIGTDRARTKPYARTLEDVESQRELLARVRAAHDEYAETLAERARLNAEFAAERERLEAQETAILTSIAAVLEKTDTERKSLEEKTASLARSANLPEDLKAETLARAESSLSSAQKTFESAVTARDEAERAFEKASGGIKASGSFAGINEETLRAAEDAVVDFVERRRTLLAIMKRLEAITAKADQLYAKWGDEFALLAAVKDEEEEFLAASEANRADVKEKSARMRDGLALATSNRRRYGTIVGVSGAVAVAAAIAAVLSLVLLRRPVNMLAAASAGALAVGAAVASLVAMKRSRTALKETWRIEGEESAEGGEIAELDRRVEEITAPFGHRDREGLISALREFRIDEAAVTTLDDDSSKLEGEKDPALEAVEDALVRMRPAAVQIGLGLASDLSQAVTTCLEKGTPEQAGEEAGWQDVFAGAASVVEVRNAFKTLWEKCGVAREARSKTDTTRGAFEKAAGALAAYEKEKNAAEEAMGVLLARAKAGTPDELRTLLDERELLAKVRSDVEALAQREKRVLGDESRESFEGSWSAVERPCEKEALIAENDIPAARRDYEAHRRESESLKTDVVGLDGVVEAGIKNLPEMSAVEETIAQLEERHGLQAFHRDALGEAFRVICEAAETFHEEVYPRIEASFTDLLSRVTLGAHEKASISSVEEGSAKKLEIAVLDGARGAPVPPEHLSQGALEQVYLCFRLALVEALSSEEPLPVLLDDPFINYDDFGRLKAAVGILSETARHRQVFLFTCQENVRDYARAVGGKVVAL